MRRLLRKALSPLLPRGLRCECVKQTEMLMLLGKLHVDRVAKLHAGAPLAEAEFRVFSQFGDDGIIQHLIRHVPISSETFIEFGVQDYRESNTRFLLLNDNWRGLVIDGDARAIASIWREEIAWRQDLSAVARFLDRDNINGIFRESGFQGKIGLLSIDVDGVDYWIWERIDAVEPDIVIAEYNSVFGPRMAVTVPYDPAFARTRAHHSNLFWGCSLRALELLGKKKGYALVGSNSAGNNAYFVRQDRLGPLVPLAADAAYVESRFRESRDEQGHKTFVGGKARLEIIRHLPVVDVETGRTAPIGELSGLRSEHGE